MKVVALVKGSFTVSSFSNVTSIAVTTTTISITGVLDNGSSTTPATYPLDRSVYIVRIIEN